MFLSKRNGIWYLFYSNSNGKRKSISTRTRKKSEAIKFLTRFSDEIKKRDNSSVIPIKLQDFINLYLRDSDRIHTYKTAKDFERELNMLLQEVGNFYLSEITPKLLSEYVRKRGQKSIYVHSKCLRYLKAIFNWAVQQQYLTENPCKNIKPIKIPEKQPLFLSKSDFQSLLNATDNKDLKDIVIFAVNTGLRKGEIISLQWSQINFQGRYVILDNENHTTKSKKVRTIPLNMTAFEVLNKRKNLNHKFVFSLNGDAINPDFVCKQFKKCVIKAGLNSKLKFHSTRHTFASWLVQRGVSIYEVSKLLGHSDIKTTEIYSHLRADDLIDSVRRLDN